jgi:hypothetical protein
VERALTPASFSRSSGPGCSAPVSTGYDLADGPKALAELEALATVGKLALVP